MNDNRLLLYRLGREECGICLQWRLKGWCRDIALCPKGKSATTQEEKKRLLHAFMVSIT